MGGIRTVRPGKPRIADNIGDQNRRQFPGLAHPRAPPDGQQTSTLRTDSAASLGPPRASVEWGQGVRCPKRIVAWVTQSPLGVSRDQEAMRLPTTATGRTMPFDWLFEGPLRFSLAKPAIPLSASRGCAAPLWAVPRKAAVLQSGLRRGGFGDRGGKGPL
jgi:hypothetical protein